MSNALKITWGKHEGAFRCQASVTRARGWHTGQCVRRGVNKENHKHYCKQHTPSAIATRRQERDDKEKKVWATKKERWERINAMDKFCEGVSNKELKQLGGGWFKRQLESDDQAAELSMLEAERR